MDYRTYRLQNELEITTQLIRQYEVQIKDQQKFVDEAFKNKDIIKYQVGGDGLSALERNKYLAERTQTYIKGLLDNTLDATTKEIADRFENLEFRYAWDIMKAYKDNYGFEDYSEWMVQEVKDMLWYKYCYVEEIYDNGNLDDEYKAENN